LSKDGVTRRMLIFNFGTVNKVLEEINTGAFMVSFSASVLFANCEVGLLTRVLLLSGDTLLMNN
jgi:hypothetical protein